MQAAEKEDEAAFAEMVKKIEAALVDFENKGMEVYQQGQADLYWHGG